MRWSELIKGLRSLLARLGGAARRLGPGRRAAALEAAPAAAALPAPATTTALEAAPPAAAMIAAPAAPGGLEVDVEVEGAVEGAAAAAAARVAAPAAIAAATPTGAATKAAARESIAAATPKAAAPERAAAEGPRPPRRLRLVEGGGGGERPAPALEPLDPAIGAAVVRRYFTRMGAAEAAALVGEAWEQTRVERFFVALTSPRPVLARAAADVVRDEPRALADAFADFVWD